MVLLGQTLLHRLVRLQLDLCTHSSWKMQATYVNVHCQSVRQGYVKRRNAFEIGCQHRKYGINAMLPYNKLCRRECWATHFEFSSRAVSGHLQSACNVYGSFGLMSMCLSTPLERCTAQTIQMFDNGAIVARPLLYCISLN